MLFELGSLPDNKTVTLTIAIAGHQGGNLRVQVNGTTVLNNQSLPYSNSVLARSGMSSGYSFVEVPFSSSLLITGANTLTLSHPAPSGTDNKQGIIYDALRLEIDFLPGDYNNNGVVDAADYTLYRDALGTSTTLPNDTTPGSVTAADYSVWQANFGQGAPSAAAAVPEPAGSVRLIAFLLLFTVRNRAAGYRQYPSM